jgi:predicted RNA-binding protein
MGLDIDVKKIKGSPYKVVLSKSKVIGIFDCNKFIEKKKMTGKHLKVASIFSTA